ncbi:carbohydrate-binding domain-containing protein [Azospirillum sp. sgz302134]
MPTDSLIDIPIVVNAWGVSAGGRAPHFKLLIDGVLIGEAWVTAASSAPYGFQATVNPDEGHRISVWYDNDGVVNGVDRNLFVGSITVGGQEIKATDQRVTYDKGVVDGKNVVAGQEGLYWGGQLDFGLGEEMFGGPMVRPPPKPEPVITRPITITVDAARTGSGSTAHFKLLVDGQVIGEADADSATAKPFAFTVGLDPAVAHTVQVLPSTAGTLSVADLVVNGSRSTPAAAVDGSVAQTVAAPLFQGTASKAAASSGAAFYVAANGKDTWSGRLAAPNADGTDGPFASLERAQAAMRGSAIKTTYVREGTYRLSRTLDLTAQDSGVQFLGYPGEQVVLSGGQAVSSFRSEGNGVWSASLGSDPGLDVTVNGVRYRLASKTAVDPGDPTSGWSFADAATGGPSARALRYHAGEVSAADLVPGLKIQVFDAERLQDAILEVAGIDEATRTITFTSDAPFSLSDGSTFRLLGNSAWVDQPGEFAYRASDGRLVINVGAGAAFDGTGVSVARLGTLLRLTGATGVVVQGLTFADATTDGNAVDLIGADGNRVTGNSFLNVGTGVRLTQGSDQNLIDGNYLDHLGINGLTLDGQSNGNRISGNQIQRIGEVRKYGGGIMASGVNGTEIAYNDIDHSARYGISLKNWNAATLNLNNAILYNRIRHTGEETADSGGIEMLGRSGVNTGTLIKGNWIEHVGGLATTSAGQWLRDYKGYGVYLDDLTSGVAVQDNFLKDTSWANVMIHGGHDNTVTNNIGVLATNDESFLRIEWVPLAGAAGLPANNTVTGNIVEGEVPLGSYITLLSAGDNAIDGNFLHRVGAYGPNDRSGDPMFADAYDHDYSLLPLSPALAAGIHDLAWMLMAMAPGTVSFPPPQVGSGGTSLPPVPQPVPQPVVKPTTTTQPSPTPAVTTPARPSVLLSRIQNGVTEKVTAYAYEGPVPTLKWSFLGNAGNEVVGGSGDNDFMNLLGGDDAATGGAGDDVLDGGSGSNWLIGGAGKDTFFVDGRNPDVTWSTVVDLEKGEWATMWGFRSGVSKLSWEEMAGAEGHKGATVRCDIDGNGSIDASMTFAGKAVGAMTVTTGMAGDQPYIAFITLR